MLVVVALLGGWMASVLLDADLAGFFEIRTRLIAVVGSMVLLVIHGFSLGAGGPDPLPDRYESPVPGGSLLWVKRSQVTVVCFGLPVRARYEYLG